MIQNEPPEQKEPDAQVSLKGESTEENPELQQCRTDPIFGDPNWSGVFRYKLVGEDQ